MKLLIKYSNEEDFFNKIKKVKYWNFPKISLYAVEDILDYIDELLEKLADRITLKHYREDCEKSGANSEGFYSNFIKELKFNEEKILLILNFLTVLIPNSQHKEIFCSFDNLGLIFKETMNLSIKTKINEIIMFFNGVKRNSLDNSLGFVDCFNFGIYLRPIIVEDLLDKSINISNIDIAKGKKKIFKKIFFLKSYGDSDIFKYLN